MELRELVQAIVTADLLAARQWVADARRENMRWERLAAPPGLSDREMSVAAGIVEMLAWRAGAQPPVWTSSVGAVEQPFVLDPGLEKMPRSFAYARLHAPEPLRKRNLLALPDFLDVA